MHLGRFSSVHSRARGRAGGRQHEKLAPSKAHRANVSRFSRGSGAELKARGIALGLYLIVPFAAAFGVPEREGGAVAMAMAAALPLLTFFAWLEHRVAGNTAAGFALAAIGAAIVLAAVHAGESSRSLSESSLKVRAGAA
jgi:hypothetical protein